MAPGETKQTAQQQLDSRALEVAAAALGRVEALEQRMDSREARADADRTKMREEMRDGFSRVTTQIVELGQAVHGRISKINEARFRVIYGLAGSLIVVLLAVIGWLLTYSPPWGGQ